MVTYRNLVRGDKIKATVRRRLKWAVTYLESMTSLVGGGRSQVYQLRF